MLRVLVSSSSRLSIMERYAKLTGIPTTKPPSTAFPPEQAAAPIVPKKNSLPHSHGYTNILFSPAQRAEVPQHAKLPLVPGLTGEGISDSSCLRVSLLGLPNAGKSSLVNALVKAPIAAVSPKSHTTREVVQGVATVGNFQLVVDDLPGLVAARKSDEVRKFVSEAWVASEAADLKLLVVDVTRRVDPGLVQVLRRIENFADVILVLNKVDALAPNSPALQLKRKELENLSTDGSKFSRVFFVSAKCGNGVQRLLSHLQARAQSRPWLFPQAAATSLSKVEQVEQQTRTFLYSWFNRDLPYKLRPEVVSWNEEEGGQAVTVEIELKVKDSVVARMVHGVRSRLLRNLEEKVGERLTKLWGKSATVQVVVRAEKTRESRRDRQQQITAGLERSNYRL